MEQLVGTSNRVLFVDLSKKTHEIIEVSDEDRTMYIGGKGLGLKLIYDRMKRLGILDRLEKNQPIKDWSTGRDGGPGKIKKDNVKV